MNGMKAKTKNQALGFFFILLTMACNKSGFTGGAGDGQTATTYESSDASAAAGTDGASGTDQASSSDVVETAGSGRGSDACVQGDIIKLKLPAPIQDCMNQGRIFYFKTNECLTATQASYACNFDAMAQKVESIGVRNATIFKAKADGALLVACGEKDAGKTVIAQWYNPAPGYDRCSDPQSSSRVTTACYKLYVGPAPTIVTKEDQDRVLLSCLQG